MFVRWENLKVEREEARRLPGYAEPVVRTFDAPEAMDIRFYEVHARSALNRVPEMSKVPFRWTINPYRGCSHACVYCASGDTPILMADGRTKPIAACAGPPRRTSTPPQRRARPVGTRWTRMHPPSVRRAAQAAAARASNEPSPVRVWLVAAAICTGTMSPG